MEYLVTAPLDNSIHDISYDQLRLLYEDNLKELNESQKVTASTYRGESYYTTNGDVRSESNLEYLYRDPKTAGTRMYYPHGIVICQSERRNYYRGEKKIYPTTEPSLFRKLKKYKTLEEQELYRLVADMRIAEFSFLLQKFQHVLNWNHSDILYDAIAQHYGFETAWLDVTSDFNTALFFATCYWDGDRWLPLTKEQTEVDENHQYGMIFHMPSDQMSIRWIDALEKLSPWSDEQYKDDNGNMCYKRLEYPVYRGDINNIIYPLGFQPFMRCHMQNGYGIYMRKSQPLQSDIGFEKLRFRHSEKLSERVFELMRGGELIYPQEGLKEAQFIIDQIKNATAFSEEAFQYALYHSHQFKLCDAEKVKSLLNKFVVDGHNIIITDAHPWKIAPEERSKIDRLYQSFSVQDRYGIQIVDRKQIPPPAPFYEPWMLPDETSGEGVQDFKLRENVECGTSIANRSVFSLLNTVEYGRLSDF